MTQGIKRTYWISYDDLMEMMRERSVEVGPFTIRKGYPIAEAKVPAKRGASLTSK